MLRFNPLMRLDRGRRREQQLLFAQLTAAVINFGFCRPEEQVSIEDLMPVERKVVEEEELTDKRRKEIADAFRRWARRNAKQN